MDLSLLTRDQFIKELGNIYEHSSWVATYAYDNAPKEDLRNFETLQAIMKTAVDQAGSEAQLILIRNHPDLAPAKAELSKLTKASNKEQKGAGLDQCSEEEYEAFNRLNKAYRDKFDFPFIVAVKGLNRSMILEQFKQRLNNNDKQELQTAITQIHKIASFRLHELFKQVSE